jgi:Ca2+-binding RTX toxin-like protein
MAWHAPISGTTAVTSNVAGDGIFVGPEVTLSVSGGSAVHFESSSHVADIYGTVVSTSGGAALRFGTNPSFEGQTIDIHAGAFLRAYSLSFGGVIAAGYGTQMTNAGDIAGGAFGLLVSGFNASTTSQLTNSGTIENFAASALFGTVTRQGSETFLLTNTGTISGALNAYYGGPDIDRIVNSGLMDGDIVLNDDHDRYSGASGELRGKLFGGAGNDVAIGGADGDWFEGGEGNDTLTSNGGIDRLFGQGGMDTLNGGIGNDILNSGADADILIGGVGKDQLTGGGGNDTFRFTSKTHSLVGANADRIYDFDDAGNDRIDISALFGPAMVYRHGLAFTGAGQVRINDVAGADVIVEVNTGGTLAPDFAIRLVGTTLASMTASDFVL